MSDSLRLLLASCALFAGTDSFAGERLDSPPVQLHSRSFEWTRGISFSDLPAQSTAAPARPVFENVDAPIGWSTAVKGVACLAALYAASATGGGDNGVDCGAKRWSQDTHTKTTPEEHPLRRRWPNRQSGPQAAN